MLKFFAEKMWVAFAVQKLLTFFSAKNFRILYIESAKTVNEMTLNELIKLTTLWTTGPSFMWQFGQCYLGLHCLYMYVLYMRHFFGYFAVEDAAALKITVDPHYLDLAYLEKPLISKWNSGPYFKSKNR